jgi:Leucine-rich repeat (LRR) protein
MKETSVTDRLTFLAEQFDIFECSTDNIEDSPIEAKLEQLNADGFESNVVRTNDGKVIAILSTRTNEKNRILKKVSVCSEVFSDMIAADPTDNKMYLQWMLTVFTRFLKDSKAESISAAIRFVNEDLPQANVYLILFEDNKRKRKFIDLCLSSYALKHVGDPTNINQYKSLSQLFDAVDPFIEREPSAVERTMEKFVESGQALIPVKDRKFTLFIPKTTAANVVFDKFANWCTAKEGNGMFKSYTTGHKKPNGENSDIYIIINNKFFSGESEELYQIHFETNQLKDRKNSSNVSIFESVLMESEGLTNYFYEELMTMAKGFKKGIENNKYLDYLIQFGFTESLFEMFSVDSPSIKIMKREVPKLPDMSRFTEIDQLIITDAKLVELHPSVGNLTKLQMLVLTNNRIKSLPSEIGQLKEVNFINITGNPIKDIPSEIAYLDKSNGGSLFRIAVDEKDIGAENYQKLKRLLPQTLIN